MAGPATLFRELHRLRRHAKDLQAEIDRGPRLLKGQQTKVAQRQEELQQAQDAIKRLKVTALEKEGAYKATLQQITKYQKQLNTAGTKKEMDALQAEIATARKAQQRHEDETLEAMAETEEKTAQVPEQEKALRQAKEELAQFERDFQSRQAGLAEQLAQAQQSLAEAEHTLAADVRAQYQRAVTARGEDALALVQECTCTACYTAITAQNYNDLVQGLFILCKSCGRILYLAE
jgi:predicted  nucleic acid-binding Zn-ribbon protein